jgi:protein-glutamine gamma-glutamyltransferase
MTKAPASLLKARLWMNAAVVSALLAHALQGLNWSILAGLASCAACAAVQWFGLQARPPQCYKQLTALAWLRWLAPLVAALAVGVLAWQFRTVFGREVGVTSLTILTAFKLWEYNKARDAQILAGLLFFLLLSVFLRQESALALASVIVSAVITLSAWVYFNSQVFNSQVVNSLVGGAAQRSVLTQAWHAPLRETLRLALYGLPLAILLFFVFPRIAGPLWGLPQDAQSSKLGLSNTLEPGRFAKLAGSDELAFRVKFKGAVPTANQLYWRGPVLSDFDGLLWTVNANAQSKRIQASAKLLGDPQAIAYTLVAEPHKQTFRVLLDVPLKADTGIELSSQASPVADTMLERETVQAASYPSLQWGDVRPANSPRAANAQRLALQSEIDLPFSFNPRSFALAAQLRASVDKDKRFADNDPTPYIAAVMAFYQQSFKYSLEPPTPKGRPQDAIDGFLFDTQTGYCQHFAASFVVLMRAMDFPARIVTGYQGGDLNPQDGWMVVPQNAAHAWAEVLHPTQGWLRVDPTSAAAPWRTQAGGSQLQNSAGQAPSGVQSVLKTTREALLPLQQWAQATLRVWQDYGLNYGKNSQKTLFQTLGFDDVSTQAVASILGGGLGVWTLVMLFLHRHQAAKRSAHAKALAQFDAQCKQLKLPRLAAQTPAAWFAAHHAALTQADAQRLQQWLASYQRTHYAKGL